MFGVTLNSFLTSLKRRFVRFKRITIGKITLHHLLHRSFAEALSLLLNKRKQSSSRLQSFVCTTRAECFQGRKHSALVPGWTPCTSATNNRLF